jgi:hypothetical protein
MTGYGATVWDLLPTYPPRIMGQGAPGGSDLPPQNYGTWYREAAELQRESGEIRKFEQHDRARSGTYLPLQNYGTWGRGGSWGTDPLGIAERWHRNLPSLAKERNPGGSDTARHDRMTTEHSMHSDCHLARRRRTTSF